MEAGKIKWDAFDPKILSTEEEKPASVNLTGRSCGGSCIGGNCKSMPKSVKIR